MRLGAAVVAMYCCARLQACLAAVRPAGGIESSGRRACPPASPGIAGRACKPRSYAGTRARIIVKVRVVALAIGTQAFKDGVP
eukprot:16447311-Heterocapsa_arctica.AAC.1